MATSSLLAALQAKDGDKLRPALSKILKADVGPIHLEQSAGERFTGGTSTPVWKLRFVAKRGDKEKETHLVAKWVKPSTELRRGSYLNERQFYLSAGSVLRKVCRLPHLLMCDEGPAGIAFLFDDLTVDFPLHPDGLDRQQGHATLRWLARFHGSFWEADAAGSSFPAGMTTLADYWGLAKGDNEERLASVAGALNASSKVLKANGVWETAKTLGLIEDVPLKDFEVVAQETWQAAGYPGLHVGDYNSMGSVTRPMVSENVYDVAAGAPKQLPVSPHSEQAYLFNVPRFAAFMCIKAAEKGGELQLFDNVQLGRRLGKLMEKFSRLGITYYRVMGDKLRSANWSYPTGMWQDRFQTDDWLLAKKKASENLAYGGAELREYEQGLVVMNWTVPAVTFVNSSTEVSRAVLQSILDNHRSRNYAAAADSSAATAALHSTWGDGSELVQEELQRLQEATTQSLEVEVLLRSGQVIVIDNWRFAHGRLPYEGARNHAALISDRFPRAEPPKFSVSEL